MRCEIGCKPAAYLIFILASIVGVFYFKLPFPCYFVLCPFLGKVSWDSASSFVGFGL